MAKSEKRAGDTLSLDTLNFGSYEGQPEPPSGHVHEAIEISAFEEGSVTMLYGGREVVMRPNRLVVHWGLLPHQALSRDPDSLVVGIHVPLSWFLQWEIPGAFIERVLNLELLIDTPRKEPCSDVSLLRNWHCILGKYGKEAEPIVLKECQGRLLRMALDAKMATDKTDHGTVHPPAAALYRALELIALKFREPLRIVDIAAHAGLSSRHLTRTFYQYTGETINEYLTRLRLSYAQRLLVTTDRTVTDIMYDAGFTCSTHFYEVFGNQTGLTPSKYRSRKQ